MQHNSDGDVQLPDQVGKFAIILAATIGVRITYSSLLGRYASGRPMPIGSVNG